MADWHRSRSTKPCRPSNRSLHPQEIAPTKAHFTAANEAVAACQIHNNMLYFPCARYQHILDLAMRTKTQGFKRTSPPDLLLLAIQIELSLRETTRIGHPDTIEEVYDLLREGASGVAVAERLQTAIDESPRARGKARASDGEESDLQRRVGLVVRRLRENGGRTQRALAEVCGITQAAVSQIEGGKRINNINSLDRISNALGLSLGRLIELANLEDFEQEVLLAEAIESSRDVEREGTVPLESVVARLRKR